LDLPASPFTRRATEGEMARRLRLLRRVAPEALLAGCRPVIVVTGGHADRTCGEVCDLPVRVIDPFVVAPFWRR
jgi:hypothetical protein